MFNIAIGGFRQWAGIDIGERREFPVERDDSGMLVFSIADHVEGTGDFEEFLLKSVNISQMGPNVAISKTGNITLNSAATQLLGMAERVILLYHAGRCAIGLRAATSEERHSRPMRKAKNQRTWVIAGEGFLKEFAIPHAEGRSYQPNAEGGILVVSLDAPKPSRRSRKINDSMQVPA